ncbi:MAG: filamentous hemagglutinin N-terminal domain-containing protein [Desulfobacterales bacterium]|nr:filamentous hemagglutinin N-terminal domain-containing protein [Desulfobacterales bacterium]
MKSALSLMTVFLLIMSSLPVNADIVRGIKLDGTVGNAGTLDLPGPDYDIRAEYGHQAGGNLFHSFSQFNIHSDESAAFSGPDSVQNIISRVTGGDASWIDGKLGSTIPNADLYFLNPAGVMFGSNASLDLGGSFHVSTADYLRMGDNEQFSASPIAGEVFSSANPSAFGFLDSDVAPISLEGRGVITEQEWIENPTGLRVKEGKTISVVGGDIEIKNGTSFQTPILDQNGNPVYIQDADEFGNPKFETEVDENGDPILDEQGFPVYKLDENGALIPIYALDENGNPIPMTRFVEPGDIEAPGGRFNMAAVADEGEIVLKDADLDASSFAHMGDITFTNKATADINGEGGGAVYIRAGRFALDNSVVKSNTIGGGNGKGIDIEADELEVANGGGIASNTYAAGDGGNLNIRIKDTVVVSGETEERPSYIEASTQYLSGKAGSIELDAKNLEISNGAVISSASHGSGQGGKITLRVSDMISLSGGGMNFTGIFATAQGQTGAGGTIEVATGKLNIANGSMISTGTLGEGIGGNIEIQADDSVTLSGEDSFGFKSAIFANSWNQTEGAGDGGIVKMTTRELNITGGAGISTSTRGGGQGGDIIIQADDITLSGESRSGQHTVIFANTEGENKEASGKGGTIELSAETLTLSEGSEITATTFGPGEGGNINIYVREMTVSGKSSLGNSSSVLASAEGQVEGAGKGGTIEVTAEKLYLSEGGKIVSISSGPGQGGNIKLHTKYSAIHSDEEGKKISGLYAITEGKTDSAGKGGIIEVTTDDLYLTDSATITTSSKGRGVAGDIYLDIKRLRQNNNSSVISASSAENNGGDAGTVNISASDSIILSGNSTINTDADSAGGGVITIDAENTLTLSNSSITTNVKEGTGNGGDINISNPQFVIMNQGKITANAHIGDGGAIFIHTDNFVKSWDSKVTATSERGNDGEVKIEAPDLDISSSFMLLPSGYLDAARWIKTPCAARSVENTGSFVIKGRDASAFRFDDWLPSPLVWLDSLKPKEKEKADGK